MASVRYSTTTRNSEDNANSDYNKKDDDPMIKKSSSNTEGYVGDNEEEEEVEEFKYLIVRPEKGGFTDLWRYMVLGDIGSGMRFLESSEDEGAVIMGGEAADNRWVILVSIIVRKIISIFAKPMECTGFVVDFFLNLLSQNGGLFGLLYHLLHGKVVIPQRGKETFISTIGHLDGRIDLYNKAKYSVEVEQAYASFPPHQGSIHAHVGNLPLMDLCIMASKLAYENAKVVQNIVVHHWKMHFVDFYDCWNDFQKESSTQVFILCDKPNNANLILISFRGTEPFDADDWMTDFDYSWYERPKLGKVHMGFLEALGLGNRADIATFQNHLHLNFNYSNYEGTVDNSRSEGTSNTRSDEEPSKKEQYCSDSVRADGKIPPEMVMKTAYYAVRRKLKSLLEEKKNAKFVVTGHSLGGALAILFPTVLVLHREMEVMQRLLGVYTFGQPRIGNMKLVKFMEAHLEYPVPKYFRVVYCNDLVPRLPYDDKTFLYKHFGVCLY